MRIEILRPTGPAFRRAPRGRSSRIGTWHRRTRYLTWASVPLWPLNPRPIAIAKVVPRVPVLFRRQVAVVAEREPDLVLDPKAIKELRE